MDFGAVCEAMKRPYHCFPSCMSRVRFPSPAPILRTKSASSKSLFSLKQRDCAFPGFVGWPQCSRLRLGDSRLCCRRGRPAICGAYTTAGRELRLLILRFRRRRLLSARSWLRNRRILCACGWRVVVSHLLIAAPAAKPEDETEDDSDGDNETYPGAFSSSRRTRPGSSEWPILQGM